MLNYKMRGAEYTLDPAILLADKEELKRVVWLTEHSSDLGLIEAAEEIMTRSPMWDHHYGGNRTGYYMIEFRDGSEPFVIKYDGKGQPVELYPFHIAVSFQEQGGVMREFEYAIRYYFDRLPESFATIYDNETGQEGAWEGLSRYDRNRWLKQYFKSLSEYKWSN